MTQIPLNFRTSVPTTNLEYKYFYIINSYYKASPSYIYLSFEDTNFGLNYNNIQYCRTFTDPGSDPFGALRLCGFDLISYYRNVNSSDTNKYYYKISASTSYTYTIVYYEGSNSSGSLYVKSNTKDLAQYVLMTYISRNSKTSLPTITSEDKYFYLTNSEYNKYSDYIYICLEDKNFGLNYNNIKYCRSNTNAYLYPDDAIKGCTFNLISYYSSKSSSDTNKYYYRILANTSLLNSIVYYEGSNSFGSLYVTSDYNDLSPPIKMTLVNRNSKTSLPIDSAYNNYFYFLNYHYFSKGTYIYICLEDNSFGLKYNNLKYCDTKTDPAVNPDATKSCSFRTISYYSSKRSSSTNKYYYQILANSTHQYSIFFYEGSNSSGALYVTSDYNDLVLPIKMTQINRNSRASLPISSSEDKYFYLTNSDYYQYSSYLYFNLEDNNFGLSYNNIKYCITNTNPQNNIDEAIKNCYFNSISNYDLKHLSGSTIYYYKFEINNSYTYSIVNYEGNYSSSGSLYVTSDYKSASNDGNQNNQNNSEGLSGGAVAGIVIGIIAFLGICAAIAYFRCPYFRKNNANQNSSSDSSNKTDSILPLDNNDIQLKLVANETN